MSKLPAGRSALIMRLLPSLVAGLVLLFLALLWRFDRPAYFTVMHHYIWTLATDKPFGDLGAVLQAGSCAHLGVDVFVPNGCMNGGMFNYSPVLLVIGRFGLGPADQLAGGILLCVLCLAACMLLPPARSRGELALRCAAICSSAVAHLFEAGNIDLAMFILVTVGVALQRGAFAARLTGYAFFLLGGALKFYPAAALVLALRESRRRAGAIFAVLALGAALALWRYAPLLGGVIGSLPLGLPFRGSFGAINLPFGIAMLAFMPDPSVLPSGASFSAALHHPHLAVYAMLGAKFLTLCAILWGVRLAPRHMPAVAGLDQAAQLFLYAAAVIIGFCFYAAPNYEYRGIFLYLAIPGLYAMARAPGAKRLYAVMALLVPVLLWERLWWEAGRRIGLYLPGHELASVLGIILWLLWECAWWFMAVQFTAIGFAVLFTRMRALLARPARQHGTTG